MAFVEFFGGPMTVELVADYEPDGMTTLLDLARLNDLPIYWRCAQGTCCACAVRVTTLDLPQPPRSNKERNVLVRAGKPVTDPTQANAWRTSCTYILAGESLKVEW